MANFRKSFNFRNGVQVDEDNFIVNSAGLVGIGTSVPTEFLDVRGSLKVVGVATIQDAFIGVATVTNQLEVGITSFSSGIIAAKTGIVTYYGDARYLQGMPTSQWVDTDVGLGYTSIYAAGNVGVGTTDPRFTFQVGGNSDVSNFTRGVGINSSGDVRIAGILTVNQFYGYGIGVTGLNASTAISGGTLDQDRLPSNINKPTGIITASSFVGNVTGNLVGNVTGTATTATAISGSPDLVVGVVTATKLIANTIEVPSTGITTISKLLHVGTSGTSLAALESGRLGIGTAIPTSELQIRKTTDSLLEVIGEQGLSRISIGQSVGVGKSTAVLRFGNSVGDFDIINNNNGGDINFLLNGNGSSGSGKFSWQDASTFAEAMSLSSDGNFSVLGITTLASGGGITTTGGDLFIGGGLSVSGILSANLSLPSIITSNVSVNSGLSTFATINASLIGIGTTAPNAGIDARGSDGLFGRVSIGTLPFTDTEVLKVDGLILADSIGFGTTAMNTSGIYGHLQFYDKSIEFNGGLLNIKDDCQVGFNTFSPRSVFDFGSVGSATTNPYMIMPTITTSTRTGLGATVEGAIIFNTTSKKFQGYTGTAWVDLH